MVMPFDLDATTHVFEKLEDGGLQTVVADTDDPEQVALITAVNQGTEEVMLSSYLCPPIFDVLDASGRVVGPGTPICTLEEREPKTLAPGEAVSYAYEWAGELYTIGAGSNLLAFGDYALRGWVVVLPEHRVHSDPVAVRFVDADG